MDDVESLRAELELKQNELALIMEIDRLRDTNADSANAYRGIVDLLRQWMKANTCRMYLFEKDSGHAVLTASSDSAESTNILSTFVDPELINQAARLNQVTQWQSDTGNQIDKRDAMHILVVPISLNDERLGFLLLLRISLPFSETEIQLLNTAEDQIDSLVIQGVILVRSQQTARELELRKKELGFLISIDRIRDASTDPAELHSAIVDLIAEEMDANLCLLFLADRETSEAELKAVRDKTQRYGKLQPLIDDVLQNQGIKLDEITTWKIPQEQLAQLKYDLPGDLYLAGIPISLGTEQLGFVLLSRPNRPFGIDEQQLLKSVENQLDSAILQSHLQTSYQDSMVEIATIYQIDTIRDQDISLDEMLNHVLQVMIDRIKAEMGFIALYDRAGGQLELRASTHQDLYRTWSNYQVFEQVIKDALEQAQLVSRDNLTPFIRSIVCLPLYLNEQVIGILGIVNRINRVSFSAADRRTLTAIGSQIDTAIYERREIRMLRQVLGRSVDPRVMDRLLQNPNLDVLKPERVELTVLYADIRGSTLLAEQIEPDVLVEFIRDYLTQMTEVIFSFDGTVDKFVGDEVMALFGAPIPQVDHALRAVRTGLAMQARHGQIQQAWQKRGMSAPPIGIGIVTGRMIIGEMGGSQRANYTVISREANLGARICSVAEGGQVLISEATYHLVRERIVAEPIHGQRFKGVERDVTVYSVERVIE